jgi:hypothetical protein
MAEIMLLKPCSFHFIIFSVHQRMEFQAEYFDLTDEPLSGNFPWRGHNEQLQKFALCLRLRHFQWWSRIV